MAKLKVTYFNLPAFGEPIRLLLAYSGVEFEDVLIDPNNWLNLKPKTPFGQLPLYEENGKIINQSVAIMRYLGKKYKLIGADDWEDLEIDAMAETFRDFIIKIAMYHYEPNDSAKDKLKEPLYKETIPFYLERFEKSAKENGGYLAAKKLTWVDFFFASMIDYISLMGKLNIMENNPNLKVVYDNVMNLPAIKKWYEKYPLSLEFSKLWLESRGKPGKE
nr:glutathione S-transferase-like [Onthophagus taurus]